MLNAGDRKELNTPLGAVRTKLLQGNGVPVGWENSASSSSSWRRRKYLSKSGLIILVVIVSDKRKNGLSFQYLQHYKMCTGGTELTQFHYRFRL
jgi:hypothetical protein